MKCQKKKWGVVVGWLARGMANTMIPRLKDKIISLWRSNYFDAIRCTESYIGFYYVQPCYTKHSLTSTDFNNDLFALQSKPCPRWNEALLLSWCPLHPVFLCWKASFCYPYWQVYEGAWCQGYTSSRCPQCQPQISIKAAQGTLSLTAIWVLAGKNTPAP